jgi:hypothetical protein
MNSVVPRRSQAVASVTDGTEVVGGLGSWLKIPVAGSVVARWRDGPTSSLLNVRSGSSLRSRSEARLEIDGCGTFV